MKLWKRALALTLAAMLLVTLCGCSIGRKVSQKLDAAVDRALDKGIEAVEDKVYEMVEDKLGDVMSGQSDETPDKSADASDRPIAALPEGSSYDERLEEEWADAEGEYIWTITIDDVDIIDIMGLCTATYDVGLSASHVGDDMYGSYFGEFEYNYSADLSGMEALFTAQGGSMDYDTDGWFKNDQFTFTLGDYVAEEEEMLKEVVKAASEYEDMNDEEKAMMDNLYTSVYGSEVVKDFETASAPAAFWWDYDMPMTDGDLSGSLDMSGVLGGMMNASSSVDATGRNVMADVRVAFGLYAGSSLVKVFDERYSTQEQFENPMPYTIKVYPDGQVVMTFLSATGPYTTKLYGSIDKVPVSDTVRVDEE